MAATHKITCDGCGADMTYTGNSVDYYLRLTTGSPQSWYMKEGRNGGAVTDMMIYPPIKGDHHFCGLECLDRWRGREKHRAGLWRDWHEKWREEHGSKDPTGRVHSWRSPPDEITQPLKAEFEAAALAAFPMSRRV